MTRLELHFEDGGKSVFTPLTEDIEELDGFLELIAEGEGCIVPLLDSSTLAIPPGVRTIRYATVHP